MSVKIVVGDALQSLRAMPDRSVQTAICSPPYFGLRDYGIAPSIWGGVAGCDHKWTEWRKPGGSGRRGSTSARAGRSNEAAQEKVRDAGATCEHCGAWRGSLGAEPTPQMFVCNLVAVFSEVRRVLRDDGTLWLNLGDSYNASSSGGHGKTGGLAASTLQSPASITAAPTRRGTDLGLANKQRLMIPARSAIALQDDGWFLRDEIIWHKPNPMPVSVNDRTTPAHEMIYMFSKRARYFYDMEAMKEPASEVSKRRYAQPTIGDQPGEFKQDDYESGKVGQSGRSRRPNEIIKSLAQGDGMRQPRSVWSIPTAPFDGAFCTCCRTFYQGPALAVLRVEVIEHADRKERRRWCSGCGKHDKWLSHFATFPPRIPELCITATSKPGDVVLDPFGGAGTTGLVADRMGRSAVMLEINPDYAEMARQRISGEAPLFSAAE